MPCGGGENAITIAFGTIKNHKRRVWNAFVGPRRKKMQGRHIMASLRPIRFAEPNGNVLRSP